jgi:hypothetical protein
VQWEIHNGHQKRSLVVSVIVWGAWATFKAHHRGQADVSANPTEANIRALAATVQASDNMSADNQCLKEFKSYGADGTPFLIVRGHQMKDGFDSDELIAALTKG